MVDERRAGWSGARRLRLGLVAASALAGCLVALSLALVAAGWVVHAADGALAGRRALGAAVLASGALGGALACRPPAGSARRALLLGGGSCAVIYAVLLAVAPAHLPWAPPAPDISADPAAERFQPVLLLDSAERDRPWLVARRVTHRGDLTAIDYWWAFPANRSPTLREAVPCLPLLAVARRTCFDHDGDLEGATVIVRGDRPVALHVAVHAGVYRVGWRELAAAGSVGSDGRPRLRVALGSHATYVRSCRVRCRRPDRALGRHLPEGRHDGALEIRLTDRPPPLRRHVQCLLRALCVRGDPPGDPLTQRRALRPFDADGPLEPDDRTASARSPGPGETDHRRTARAAPSAGVGLPRLPVMPLQTVRSFPVQVIALPARELIGDGPGVSVRQRSVRRV